MRYPPTKLKEENSSLFFLYILLENLLRQRNGKIRLEKWWLDTPQSRKRFSESEGKVRKISDGTIMILRIMYDKKLINEDTYRNICKKYGIE